MYIEHERFNSMYPDSMDCNTFNRLCFEACRLIDRYTTGVDGVAKLRIAFPTDEQAADAVHYCAAKIIHMLFQIEQVESSAGFDGAEVRRTISHMESGNESVTYSDSAKTSVIAAAAADTYLRESLIANTIREYLAGVTDANGVNLLFMGAYPRRYLC